MKGSPRRGSNDVAVTGEALRGPQPMASMREEITEFRVDFGETKDQQSDPLPQSAPADIHAFIGRQLRAVYDDVAKQPVPDRFLELMKQLETKTAR